MPAHTKRPCVEMFPGRPRRQRDGSVLPPKWYFHKRSRNGAISEPSQGYASPQGCRRAAARDIPGLPIVRLRARPRS